MAKALALVRPVEIPPMIGRLTPAPKLECASPNNACAKTADPAKVGGYGRAKQIIVKALIGTRRKAQRRKTKWSNAGATYVGGDAKVAVEIESTLSFPPAKPVAAVAKIGIAAEDCRACFVSRCRLASRRYQFGQ